MRNARPIGRALADLAGDAIAPTLAAHGFAGREVVARWAEIAGDRLAGRSRPLRVEWPRKRPAAPGEPAETATLVVLVESAFALELQHLAPVILQRINGRLGWSAVGRIVLRQGPVGLEAVRTTPRPALAPDVAEQVERAASGVSDEGLRAALGRLGRGAAMGRDGQAPPEG